MKKVVLQLDSRDEKTKKKAMGAVLGFPVLHPYFSMVIQDKKLTVTGDLDPVNLVNKLRKICPTELIDMVSVDDQKKKEEAKKKEDQKKKEEEAKKKEDQKKKEEEAKKKEDQKKKEEAKKKEDQKKKEEAKKKDDKRKKEEPPKKGA